MIDPDTLRIANAVIALAGLFVVSTGLVAEWHKLDAWRYILSAYTAQQAVIAYASVEAIDSGDVPIPWRVYGLFGTLTAVLVTGLVVANMRRRERAATRRAGLDGLGGSTL